MAKNERQKQNNSHSGWVFAWVAIFALGCTPDTQVKSESSDAIGSAQKKQQPAAATNNSDIDRIEKGNAILETIIEEAGEIHAPVFLYRSAQYRQVVEKMCDYKDLLILVAQSRALSDTEKEIIRQAMEHLPINEHIEWMQLVVGHFVAGKITYEQIHSILFPLVNEASEYYYHYRDPELSAFFQRLKNDSTFIAALERDNSLHEVGLEPVAYFREQVDGFLSGKTWEAAKQEILNCQIAPSHGPLKKQCPVNTVREKEKPPKWWKIRCDKAFGLTPSPDEYWQGEGSDAPWWEAKAK